MPVTLFFAAAALKGSMIMPDNSIIKNTVTPVTRQYTYNDVNICLLDKNKLDAQARRLNIIIKTICK